MGWLLGHRADPPFPELMAPEPRDVPALCSESEVLITVPSSRAFTGFSGTKKEGVHTWDNSSHPKTEGGRQIMSVVPSGAKAAGSQPVTAHTSVATLAMLLVSRVCTLCGPSVPNPDDKAWKLASLQCRARSQPVLPVTSPPLTHGIFLKNIYFFTSVSNAAHWDDALGVQAWSCHNWQFPLLS